MKNRSLNSQKGITLIALIVTAIVLLILCGITISAVTGDKGLIKETKSAVKDWEESDEKHRIESAVINSTRRGKALNYDKFNSELSKHFDDYTLVKDGDNFKLTLNGTEYTLNEEGNITKEGPAGSVEGGELGGGSGGETGGNDETLTLTAPALEVDEINYKLLITKSSPETESYEVIINGETKGTILATGTTTEYDLSSLDAGQYEINVIAKATGQNDSNKATTSFTREEEKSGPEYVVEIGSSDYVSGKKMVLVYTNESNVNFDYNGTRMFNVSDSKYKYNNTTAYTYTYALVVDTLTNNTLSAYEAKISYALEDTATIVNYDSPNDVNCSGEGFAGLADVIATQAVKNANATYMDEPAYMPIVIKADVNFDRKVDDSDVTIVKAEYDENR